MGGRDSSCWGVDAGGSCCAELWGGQHEKPVGVGCKFLDATKLFHIFISSSSIPNRKVLILV